MIKFFLSLLFCSLLINSLAQQEDSIHTSDVLNARPRIAINDHLTDHNQRNQRLRSLILPAGLISYGFLSLENDGLLKLDNSIREEIWVDHPHKQITIDNYLQYAPAAMVYGLNAIDIKGKDNFRDRTMIYLLSNAVMGITVQSLKAITKIQRPDGFGTNAFPSGHTATAFVSAGFLREEYKDVSPWLGLTGYAMAVTTGYLRMYNNKHWFRDLLPGAGIGIISTKVMYWAYPAIKRKFFKEKQVLPT